MYAWKLEDARSRFSEVVQRALAQEPQLVICNDRDAVVVLSAKEYEHLVQPRNLVDFLQDSPLAEGLSAGELDLERSRDLGRSVALGLVPFLS